MTTETTDRDGEGRFSAGNRFWASRLRAGPRPLYESAADLTEACARYFEWLEDEPLYEAHVTSFRGTTTITAVPKLRAATLAGLCVHLGISRTTWHKWRKSPENGGRPDLVDVMERVETIMWEQKFTGAAAGLLSTNLVARELGLIERGEVDLPAESALAQMMLQIVGSNSRMPTAKPAPEDEGA